MQGGDQCRKLVFVNVLEFIDENSQDGTRGFCRFTHLLQQVDKVSFKVAVIGQAGFRFVIDPDFNVAELHAQSTDKGKRLANTPP